MGDGSSDDGAIVREATPEVELGPPLDLSAPFVPRPATESLWLIRVRSTADWLACRDVRRARSGGVYWFKSQGCGMVPAMTPGRLGQDWRVHIRGTFCARQRWHSAPLPTVHAAHDTLRHAPPARPHVGCCAADVQHHAPGGAALRPGHLREGGGGDRGRSYGRGQSAAARREHHPVAHCPRRPRYTMADATYAATSAMLVLARHLTHTALRMAGTFWSMHPKLLGAAVSAGRHNACVHHEAAASATGPTV